jgi:hypothetical protein
MKKIMLVVLLCGVVSCAVQSAIIDSGWSSPVNGLQLQISSASQFSRFKGEYPKLEVTCIMTNSGSVSTGILHVARLYLVDSSGATNMCQRQDDKANRKRSRPMLAPGQVTSWKQDGAITVAPGIYALFARWDGNWQLQSPPVQITIK